MHISNGTETEENGHRVERHAREVPAMASRVLDRMVFSTLQFKVWCRVHTENVSLGIHACKLRTGYGGKSPRVDYFLHYAGGIVVEL